jgi:hypothetical protein
MVSSMAKRRLRELEKKHAPKYDWNLADWLRHPEWKYKVPDNIKDIVAYIDKHPDEIFGMGACQFNDAILGRSEYWPRQKQICYSVEDCPSTYVVTGNAVGKTYVAAGIFLWFLFTKPGSLVLATAPTQAQLELVLWKEIEKAYRGSRIPLGGRMLKSPLKIEMGMGWQGVAYSTKTTERFSGHHAKDTLVVMDEASGVDDAIYEAISSLNPSRSLMIGNPIRPSGAFYDRCSNADPVAPIYESPSTTRTVDGPPELGENVRCPDGKVRMIEGFDDGVPFVVKREAGIIDKVYVR